MSLEDIHWSHRTRNWLHTVLLVSGMMALCAWLGWELAGWDGVVAFGLMVAASTLLGSRISPRLIFRLYRARPLDARGAPGVVHMVDAISRRAGLPAPPRLYYLPTRLINAFAAGTRDDAGLGITDGLLRSLDTREVAGVLAHEIAHLRHGDLRVMNLADLITRTVHFFSWFGQILLILQLPLVVSGVEPMSWTLIFLLIFSPALAALMQLALSRQREYEADRGAVELTGDARGLASALQKMERLQGGFLERIFLPGRRVPEPSLLRTHPPTDERIRRLLELEPRPGAEPPWQDAGPARPPVSGQPPPRPGWHVSGLWH